MTQMENTMITQYTTQYFEDTNEVFSTRIWELVKAGNRSYNLFEFDGIRNKDCPKDEGPTEVVVQIETLYRKTQKDEWVSIEQFLKQKGVTPFGKVRYTIRHNVTIAIKSKDWLGTEWTVGTIKYWFTKKCSDMSDGVLGGGFMEYDRMGEDIEVAIPTEAMDGEFFNKDYYTNLQAAWLILVDRHVKAENQQKMDELVKMFA